MIYILLSLSLFSLASNKSSNVVDNNINSGLVTIDSENLDDMDGISHVLKYTILAIICIMAFSIRLFAVVRWESVRYNNIFTFIFQ